MFGYGQARREGERAHERRSWGRRDNPYDRFSSNYDEERSHREWEEGFDYAEREKANERQEEEDRERRAQERFEYEQEQQRQLEYEMQAEEAYERELEAEAEAECEFEPIIERDWQGLKERVASYREKQSNR
ncbi:MAG: hypothetical protein V3W37_10030 [Candidatus Binatia bacterium]